LAIWQRNRFGYDKQFNLKVFWLIVFYDVYYLLWSEDIFLINNTKIINYLSNK